MTDFSILKGETLISIKGLEKDSSEVFFKTKSGSLYRMQPDSWDIIGCCYVDVSIYEIDGDATDILKQEILEARVQRSDDGTAPPPEEQPHEADHIWTFYHLRTLKASLCIRWFGSSNGYYSTEVNFEEIKETK